MVNNVQNMPSRSELEQYIELLQTAQQKYNELIELQKEAPSTRFLSIEDVCHAIKCSDKTAKKLFNDPEFPSENYGRSKMVSETAFLEFFSVRRDKHNSAYWN